jgi:hypothetical protein
MAVIGLAGQLFDASLTGYTLLETAQSFGKDYEDLRYQLTTEKRFLEKWAKAWVHDQGHGDQKMEPDHEDYPRFCVQTALRKALRRPQVAKLKLIRPLSNFSRIPICWTSTKDRASKRK